MVLKGIIGLATTGMLIASCSSNSGSGNTAEMTRADNNKPLTQEEVQGIYTINCVSCHGVDGKLKGSGAADLSISKIPDTKILETINKGNDKGMMPYEDMLSEKEREGLVEYVKSLRK